MPDWDILLEHLRGSLGAEAVSEDPDGLPTGEIPARMLATPGGVDQLREAVRAASTQRCPIYPLGGRTLLGLGLPARSLGIGLSSVQLDRVIDYPSRDMTITVQAGISLTKLQEILRAQAQRLPVDVPRPDRATLGGTVACNISGPRRYAYGTLRDYVIGIRVVDGDGNETKAGGRVVKNVAGYDLCKLYTGSLGTLGIVTQVTLKLRPVPEATALAWIKLENLEAVCELLDRLVTSRMRPTCIELLNAAAAEQIAEQIDSALPARPWILLVGFEDNAGAVAWQRQQLEPEVANLRSWLEWFEAERAAQLWDALVEFQALEPGELTFKANFLSSGTVRFLDAAQRQAAQWAIQVHAGNGIAYGHALPGADPDAVRSSVARLCRAAVELRGNLIVRRCPTEWKSILAVWGEPREEFWLMKALKDNLDSQGILNPGRFVGGI